MVTGLLAALCLPPRRAASTETSVAAYLSGSRSPAEVLDGAHAAIGRLVAERMGA